MSDNYKYVRDAINKMLYRVMTEISRYLENIIKAPSTINRIITYYGWGNNIDKPSEWYITFNDQIIKTITIDLQFEDKYLNIG